MRQSSFLPALFVCGKNLGVVSVWNPEAWGWGAVGQDSLGKVVLLNEQRELGLGKAPPPAQLSDVSGTSNLKSQCRSKRAKNKFNTMCRGAAMFLFE